MANSCSLFIRDPVNFNPNIIGVAVENMADALTRLSGFLENKAAVGNVSLYINCYNILKAYASCICFDKHSVKHTAVQIPLITTSINVAFSEISDIRVSFHDTDNCVFIIKNAPDSFDDILEPAADDGISKAFAVLEKASTVNRTDFYQQ